MGIRNDCKHMQCISNRTTSLVGQQEHSREWWKETLDRTGKTEGRRRGEKRD